MKTQIVYVVISSDEDNYFEQVWASAWSLKHYNPDAHVTILTDEATKNTIYADDWKESLNYIDEIITVEFDGAYSNMEKSRWIKTNMRNLVTGDFLFIDADTIITGDLSNIDSFDCSIGAVLDSHCHAIDVCDSAPFQDMYVDRLKKVYDLTYEGQDVFNSGVMYVKDDESTNLFFNTWHKNWLISRSKGFRVDQLSLLKTNIELGLPIVELPGEYNCQISFSIQYLTRAIIVHTFAHNKLQSPLSPIMEDKLYDSIKQQGCITESIANVLLHCKETFISPTYLLGKEWMKIRFNPSYFLIESTYKSNNKFDKFALSSFNFIARILGFILRYIHKF